LFHPERELNRIIYEILQKEGKSISALSKELEQRGYKFHRLILTGYLRALTDLKFLKEREIPPAKVYIPTRARERDIYEIMGEKAIQITDDIEMGEQLILYALNRLFDRAIFEEELKRAGVRESNSGREATNEERQAAKKMLVARGFKISSSSTAFMPQTDMNQEYIHLLESVICDQFAISYLIKETKQTKLSI
jgi:DNA-binding PadR family transcriptional regulator